MSAAAAISAARRTACRRVPSVIRSTMATSAAASSAAIGPRLPAGKQAGQPGLERLHRGFRAVNTQHELRLARGLGLARGVEDGFGRRDCGVVAADPCPRGHQVASDDGTCLPQAEHRDDQ